MLTSKTALCPSRTSVPEMRAMLSTNASSASSVIIAVARCAAAAAIRATAPAAASFEKLPWVSGSSAMTMDSGASFRLSL